MYWEESGTMTILILLVACFSHDRNLNYAMIISFHSLCILLYTVIQSYKVTWSELLASFLRITACFCEESSDHFLSRGKN